LSVQKITDYHLHLATCRDIAGRITSLADLRSERLVGYIPDMIFDKELDYLGELGARGVPVASNSVAVQAMALRAGAGVGIVHDFALPFSPELVSILRGDVSLTRSFYLVRHTGDRMSDRLTRFAGLLTTRLRAEVARLEGLVA
jgi:DNA-binding transcriptional LysR family regulator